METHKCLNNQNIISNSITEIYIKKNSKLELYKIQNDYKKTSKIDNTYIYQQEKSKLKLYTISLKGDVVLNKIKIIQNGEQSNSSIQNINIDGSDEKNTKNIISLQHKKSNCFSYQNYKGIFKNNSKYFFKGKINIYKNIKHVDAYQKNNNIILYGDPIIETNPELEILSNNVKCSHGCTISRIDNNILFYLRSRGINKKKAKKILTTGFIDDIIQTINIKHIKNLIINMIDNYNII